MTQEEMNEFRQQQALSEEYQNQLKEEIENQMPFITELKDLEELKLEYYDNKFETCFDQLK